jgi:hypothetical protein
MRSTACLATLGLVLSTMSGCYLGRTRSAKSSAYVVNGMAALVGGAVALSAATGTTPHDDIFGGVGAGLVVGAAIATLVNIGVPTGAEPAPEPEPRAVALGTVTAPGLTPAIVQVR